MPPPSLSITTIFSSTGRDARAVSALASWHRATSPSSTVVGAPVATATPIAVDTTPSIPLAPRLACTVSPVADPPYHSTIAHRHRRRHDEVAADRARGQHPSHAGLRERVPDRRVDRRLGKPLGVRPVREPAVRRRRAAFGEGAAQLVDRRRDVSMHDVVRVEPASAAVDLQLDGGRRREPLAEHLRRRWLAETQHDIGRMGVDERPDAHDRVERPDRRGTMSTPRARLGQNRPTQGGRQRIDRCAVTDATTGDDHAASPAHRRGDRLDVGRQGQTRPADDRRDGCAEILDHPAHERFTHRQVEMDRTWIGPARGSRPRLIGHRRPGRRCRDVGDARIVEPPRRATEEHGLIDRLRRADIVQLGWPVGGEGDQRHVGQAGLDHRRVEVGGGRPAGAQRHRRETGGQSDPEGDERRAAFVVHDLDAHAGLGQRQRHRGAARTRRHHRVAQPQLRPAAHQRGAERGLDVGGGEHGRNDTERPAHVSLRP